MFHVRKFISRRKKNWFISCSIQLTVNKRRLNLSIFYVVAVTIKYNNNKYTKKIIIIRQVNLIIILLKINAHSWFPCTSQLHNPAQDKSPKFKTKFKWIKLLQVLSLSWQIALCWYILFLIQTQQQNSNFENLRLQITEEFASTSTESLRKIIYLFISYHIKETSQRKITGIVKFLFDLS